MKTTDLISELGHQLLATVTCGRRRAEDSRSAGLDQLILEVTDTGARASIVITTTLGRQLRLSLEELPVEPLRLSPECMKL
jgi:hypothetical protein